MAMLVPRKGKAIAIGDRCRLGRCRGPARPGFVTSCLCGRDFHCARLVLISRLEHQDREDCSRMMLTFFQRQSDETGLVAPGAALRTRRAVPGWSRLHPQVGVDKVRNAARWAALAGKWIVLERGGGRRVW